MRILDFDKKFISRTIWNSLHALHNAGSFLPVCVRLNDKDATSGRTFLRRLTSTPHTGIYRRGDRGNHAERSLDLDLRTPDHDDV